MNPVKDMIWQALSFPATPFQIRNLQMVFEKEIIIYTLKCTNGNKLKAARVLDLNRNTLHKMCKNLGIDARDYKEV